jgi:hypothetical protein
VALFRPALVASGFALVDLAVSAFFVVQLAAFFTAVLFKGFSIIMPVKVAMKAAMDAARAAHGEPGRAGTPGAGYDVAARGAKGAA